LGSNFDIDILSVLIAKIYCPAMYQISFTIIKDTCTDSISCTVIISYRNIDIIRKSINYGFITGKHTINRFTVIFF